MTRLLGDWVEGYLAYTENQESPEIYHYWAALTSIAVAAHRKVHLHRVKYELFPNLYVLLVGASGKTRKSVALNIGLDILRNALPDENVIGDRMTAEGFIKQISRSVTTRVGTKFETVHDSAVLVHADEIANLFTNDRTRASNFSILLTRAYESQTLYEHTTSVGGKLQVQNIYINLLAATAPTNLKTIPDDATGGLLGRLIMVPGVKDRKAIAWEDAAKAKPERELRECLIHDLMEISKVSGRLEPTEEAKEFFAEWYRRQYDVEFMDPRVDAFQSRFHDTAIKIAMLHSLSHSDGLVLELSDMEKGIKVAEEQLRVRERVLAVAGASEYAQTRGKLLGLLDNHHGVASRRQLMKEMTVSIQDFDMVISALIEEGTIERVRAGKDVGYKLLD